MQRSRRRGIKFHPAPLQPRAKLQETNSYCVVCGSRNIVVFQQKNAAKSSVGQQVEKLIKCQGCGVISPDFSQLKPRSGVQEDSTPLDKTTAQQMADQILDAFTHQRTKQKLQRALAFAQGDLGLVCHRYHPIAIEVFARVVSRFGFTEGIEGVMESVRVMQNHAKDDGQLVQKLISIRKLLTPTGTWIEEDNDAEKEDLRRKELEQQALLHKQEDQRREELLALENAKKARLRAKKIALGIDPSVERPPVLLDVPPSVVAARAGARLELRVNVKYVQKFQWFFNGRPIETEEYVLGINRCTLVITKLTKRVSGEYFCICENEEGTVSTPTCRVGIAALRLSRLGSRGFGTLTSSPLYACEEKMAVACVGGKIVLYDVKTLVPAKAFPTLPAPMETLAWEVRTKMLVAFSVAQQQDKRKQGLQMFFYSPDYPDATSTANPSTQIAETHRRTSSGQELGLSTKPKLASTSNTLRFQLADVQTIDTMTDVHAAEFIDDGKRLVVTDMRHRIALYDISSAFACRKTITFDNDTVCHLAVSSRAPTLFAVSFRNKKFIRLYDGATNSNMNVTASWTPQEYHLDFKFPVHRTSFDASGFFLAVAETGFMKAWISIVNVNTKRLPQRRFIAHVGNISGLQWTTSTSLLISSSHDGYVKVWDPVAMSPLLNIHIDPNGIHAMRLMEEASILLIVGYSDCRLQSRSIIQLQELQASRRVEMNEQAVTIQKIWKGRTTRELIAKYIKGPKN